MKRFKGLLFLSLAALLLPLIVLALGPRLSAAWRAPGRPAPAEATPQSGAVSGTSGTPTHAPATATPDPRFSPGERPRANAFLYTGRSSTDSEPASRQPLCGGPPVLMILGIGADSRADTYNYGLADVIRVIRVDFTGPGVSMIALPRDLWVAIPGIQDHYGITRGKLNQAYLYGGPGFGYYDGPNGGPGLLAETLEANFGIQVDRYLAVNMVTFVEIVDALGGIEVDLPAAVDGRPARARNDDSHPQFFPAGSQTLDGAAALRLARLRENYDDFFRIRSQNLILAALQRRVLSPSMLPGLPDIVDSLRRGVRTDLTPVEIAQLACLATRLDQDAVTFHALPREHLRLGRVLSTQLGGRTSVLFADAEAVRAYLADFQAGQLENE